MMRIQTSGGVLRRGYTGLPATNCITPQMMMPQPQVVVGGQSCRPTYNVGCCPKRYIPCTPGTRVDPSPEPEGGRYGPLLGTSVSYGWAGLGVDNNAAGDGVPEVPTEPGTLPPDLASEGPTGIPYLDEIVASPWGKAAVIGAIAAGAAKTFPNKIIAPAIAGAFLAVFTGLVPDVKMGVPPGA